MLQDPRTSRKLSQLTRYLGTEFGFVTEVVVFLQTVGSSYHKEPDFAATLPAKRKKLTLHQGYFMRAAMPIMPGDVNSRVRNSLAGRIGKVGFALCPGTGFSCHVDS